MHRDEWRLLGWIGLAHVIGLALGFIILSVTMKFLGYPTPEVELGIRWRPLPLALREHGFWFLVVTACWWIAVCVTGHFGWQVSLKSLTALGILFAFALPALFLYTLTDLYTRPLLIGPAQASQQFQSNSRSAPESSTHNAVSSRIR